MCGIAGFVDITRRADPGEYLSLVRRMNGTLRHRGPDAGGEWLDASQGLALGHRRLAVIDLSAEGHQPMVSACGRFVLCFNGEIYNFRDLRRKLLDEAPAACRSWRGHSDTEVLLVAIAHWGLAKALELANGMFAFVLWDRERQELHLVRDRLGEKPLYYGYNNGIFLFGSELKALKAHRHCRFELNRDAVALLLRYNYIPAPYTIYRDIFKLLPGTYVRWGVEQLCRRESPAPVRYWNLQEIAETGIRSPLRVDPADVEEELDFLLRDAVRLRLEADVPLGAFLSGGIDSSLVVALMQAQSAQPVKTFSIGFHEPGYDEAGYARSVAKHLGTDHTEHYVSPEEALATIPLLPTLYDEPFSDSSQIPTYLVSRLAREKVTVSLSGDGGDELFSGYTRYRAGERIWGKIGRIPVNGRKALAGVLSRVPDGAIRAGEKWLPQFLDRYGKSGTLTDKVALVAEMLEFDSPALFYRRLVSHWKDPAGIVLGSAEPLTALTDPGQQLTAGELAHLMMYLDAQSYLPDDILVKLDRASMGVGLEARVPLLDHRVVELAWRVPLLLKVRKGEGKWLLRRLLARYVPPELTDRPKMGFGVPLDVWLRGPLREWAEGLLDPVRLRREGVFDLHLIRQKWVEHLTGQRNWHYYLWDILMFQAWWESQ